MLQIQLNNRPNAKTRDFNHYDEHFQLAEMSGNNVLIVHAHGHDEFHDTGLADLFPGIRPWPDQTVIEPWEAEAIQMNNVGTGMTPWN
jgi:hypothetical protein